MFTPVFMRRVSQVVLLTFTTLTLQQTVEAAEQGGVARTQQTPPAQKPGMAAAKRSSGKAHPARQAPAAKAPKGKQPLPAAIPIQVPQIAGPSTGARYGRGLERLRSLAEAASGKQAKGQNADAEIRQLREQQRQLDAMEAGVKDEFAATEKHLKDHKLPAVILARHQAAVQAFQVQQIGLKQKLKALTDADEAHDAKQREQKLRDLDAYLNTAQHPRARIQAAPDKLPFGAPSSGPAGKARAPRTTEREYRASLFKVEPVMLAGPIPNGFTLPASGLPATPTAADLAATEDIVLTPAIKALAASLNNNPVQIYNWVRNNIEYLPTYGSIQGADLTLQTRRGNDMDTASLLIALLRAANIPARYVYGTIQVPAARVQNWMGVASPDAAAQLLGQGGVPSMAVTAGGVTTAVELEHVWVSAWVDYTPSRGAINKNPDTWVEMDPSFKQYNETPGLNLSGAVSFNAQGVLDAARQGATCTADYAQALNGPNITAAYTAYKSQLANYLTQQGASLTVGDVLGTRAIIPENHPILLGTLPYPTVAVAGQFAALPDALRWKLSYALYASAMDRAQGLNTASYTASLPALLGHRFTLAFVPATAADAATLASYLPQPHANGTPILASEFPATLPAYLINVSAQLRVDGQAVAAGGSFTLGSPLAATAGLFVPASGQWDNRDHDVNAGEYEAIVADGQGIASSQLAALSAKLTGVNTQLAAGQYAALGTDDVTGLLLQQTAMGYLALADANTSIFQRASGNVDVRLPSHIRAIARIEPQYALGIVIAAGSPGIRLGIDRYAHAAVSRQNGPIAAYNRQGMERASAYIHQALQNLLSDAQHPAQGDSAVKALAAANAQSQPIRLLNAANASAVAPTLTIDANAIADIQNAALSGKRVLVQNGVLATGGWAGSGYVVEDTATGMGDYRLTAPTNGVLYPLGGAGWPLLGATGAAWPAGAAWIGLDSPAQAGASVAYILNNGATYDNVAAAVLNGMDGTRWQYFPAQEDVMNGLFLSTLNTLQPANACDAVATMIASGLAAGTGISNGNAGTLLNHPPVIQSNPVTNGAAGQAYSYAFRATDPDGDIITYSLVAGPGGMAINGATGLVTWASPLQGSYNVTLRADDGKAYTDQSYILLIGQGALQLSLNLTVNPAVATTGSPVTINVVTMGGQGTVTRGLTVDGAAVALSASGVAVVTAGAMGAHTVVATASDAVTTLTQQGVYGVGDPADTTTPVAQITAPAQDAAISAPVDIIGSATDDNLTWYQLMLRPAGAPDTAWFEIGRGYQPVAAAKLGTLDPTVLANGLYDLALIVYDANGKQSSAGIGVEIYRDLKIGQFSLSFADLNVSAVGIPIRVTRTYDTRLRNGSFDFGYGWTVGDQAGQLRKNMLFGLDWNVYSGFMSLQLCLYPGRRHKISITLPDGSMHRFSASNATPCATAQVPPVNVVFTPEPGTNSTLVPAAIPSILLAQGGQLYDGDVGAPWNPTDFQLTTEDRYVYNISEGIGITSVVDPYGNTLTYGRNGIVHSDGTGVAFTRDALNRITKITDPMGKVIQYGYDANGNLASVTNRNNETSRFAYDGTHGLASYTDPSGAQLARYTYDAKGRLIAATDASGKTIQTNHDTANSQDILTDRLGRTTTYVYDTAGDVTKIIDPMGAVTAYGYDGLGNEIQVTDPLGNITKRTFDSISSKQTSETDPLGDITVTNYDQATHSQIVGSRDANGNATTYDYFTYATNITGPLTSYARLSYDLGGNLASFVADGQGTAYGYDGKGNVTSETDSAGNTVTHTYDANGNELTRTWQKTNAAGVKVTLTASKTYDAEGRMITETDALGGVTATQYNSANKPTQVTDPAGNVTRYSYDAQARLVATIYPDGTTETVSYDAENNQTATTDRAGRTTHYTYDGKNRLTQTLHPDGTTDTITYNAAGQTVATHDANGNPISSQYDAAGRLVASTDALGHVTRYTYDPNGNRLTQTDAAGNITKYTYDALNRLTQTTYPDGTTRTITYNASNRKATETDPNGNTVSYGYDAVSRINRVTLMLASGASAVTGYAYDEQGNKIAQTDALGRTTQWSYDNANRVASRTLPNGETETFAYDKAGNRIAHTDFLGNKTSYTVDSNGRIVFATDSTGHTTGYLYTASGQVSGTSDSRGTTQYTYDASDRLTRQDNPDGSYLAYAYDANGNTTQRSTPAGTVNYAYDTLNRLVTVTNTDGKQTGYTYDANGNRTKTVLPNGTETNYTFDALNRLTGVEHRTTATQAVIKGYAYTLKPNGQRASVKEYDAAGTIRTRAYTYDSLNRLTQDVLTDARTPANTSTTAYTYGNTGNRASKTVTQNGTTTATVYTYDSDDRLTTETTPAGTTTYTWDANGNLTRKTEPTQATLYTWDSNNRLSTVQRGTTAATATTIASYTYDANGNRVSKTTATGTTTYLVDSNMPYAQVAMETAASGTTATTTSYLYGLERIQMTRGGQGTFYHDDGLGSTRLLTDPTGAITDSYDYDDYGALQSQTGTTQNSFLYAGEQFDSDANLYYNRARYLDVNTGRFVGLDPFGGKREQPTSLNKYTYANGDPVNVVDPSGRFGLTETSAATSIASTLNNAQTNFAMDFISAKLDPDSALSAKSITLTVLGIAAPFGIAKLMKLWKLKRATNLISNLAAEDIIAINMKYSNGLAFSGKDVYTAIVNASYREGSLNQAASLIRDIAGGHLFENGNKRTAQELVETLFKQNGISVSSSKLRTIIDQVGSGTLRSVEDISSALRSIF